MTALGAGHELEHDLVGIFLEPLLMLGGVASKARQRSEGKFEEPIKQRSKSEVYSTVSMTMTTE